MKKNFIIAGLLVAGLYSAQQDGSVGINAEPKGATLHVKIADGAVATEGQGIAVPNVKKTTLNAMSGTIAISAMVYVTDASGSDSERTEKVKDVGYYYFDGTEWVKLGGSSATGLTTPLYISQGVAGDKIVEEVTSLTTASWGANDFMKVLVNGFTGDVALPPAAGNENRMISVQNISGSGKNYTSANAPKNVGTINSQRAHFLISNGTNWYMIGGIGQ